MQQFFYFFIRYKVFWVFVIFEVLSLIIVFNGSSFHRTRYINSANAFTGTIYNTANNVSSYFHLRSVNDSLMAENARLQTRINYDTVSIHKKDTLAIQDTGSKYHGRFVYISADIISNSTAKRNNYMMLNAGSADGVVKQCGVVSANGAVGIVLDVSEHFCTAISLLNSNAHISIKLDQTGNAGTLIWDGQDPQVAQVNDINKHVKIEAGQTISTSGYNFIFPRNIPVGSVLDYGVEGNFNAIHVKLSASFDNLHQVYIVKNLDLEEQTQLMNSIKEK